MLYLFIHAVAIHCRYYVVMSHCASVHCFFHDHIFLSFPLREDDLPASQLLAECHYDSPTRLTATPVFCPVDPILGGKTSTWVLRFQNVTRVEAREDGLSYFVSFIQEPVVAGGADLM